MRCSVPRCNQRAKTSSRAVSFHSFPAVSNPIRQKWIDVISVANRNFKVSRSSYVCSEHFEECYFANDVINSGHGRRRLKANAIPTLFAWDAEVFTPHQNWDSPQSNGEIPSDISMPMCLEQENGSGSTSILAADEQVLNMDVMAMLSNKCSANESTTAYSEQGNFSGSTSMGIADEQEKKYIISATALESSCEIQIQLGVSDRNNELCDDYPPELTEMQSNDKDNLVKTCHNLTEEVINLQLKCMQLEKSVRDLTKENKQLKSSLSTRNRLFNSKAAQLAKEEIRRNYLKKQINRLTPSLDKMKMNDDDVKFYTGIPNYDRVIALYEYINPGDDCEHLMFWNSNTKKTGNKKSAGRPLKLKPKEQFLLVLMRLRLGLFEKDLADRFGISISLVSKITITWINAMYVKLGRLNIWPSREHIDATMPEKFKKDYPTTRVIIDATEIKVEKPNSLILQSGTYSTYKSGNTLKALIGIDPTGLVTFVSSLYTGCISDKEITRRSGLLDLQFNPTDSIMADKGFLIKDMLEEKGIALNIPPFLSDKGQFTEAEVEETQRIASLRIHIERRIQRIRTYHIFDRPIPISLCPVANQLWTVCALLTNLQTPIIGKAEDDLDEIEPVIFLP